MTDVLFTASLTGAGQIRQELQALEQGLGGLRGVVGQLTAGFAGLGVVLSAKQFVDMADSMRLMEGRLKNVLTTTEELVQVQKELAAIAQRTAGPIEAVSQLFEKMARSTQQLGLSQRQLLETTETVQKAIRVSGASASEASAGLLQLGQALGSGTLRGDELRSILEQMPRLAQAIAEGMGKTIGELRLLGEQGKLTSEQIIEALRKQKSVIEEEFGRLPTTIGQAFTKLQTSMVLLISDFDKATGATSLLANAIIFLSDNLAVLATVGGITAGVSAATLAFATLQRVIVGVGTAMAGMLAFATANPIFALAAAVATGLAAWTSYSDSVTRAGAAHKQYADTADIVAAAQGDIVSGSKKVVNSLGQEIDLLSLSLRGRRELIKGQIDDLKKQLEAVKSLSGEAASQGGSAPGFFTNVLRNLFGSGVAASDSDVAAQVISDLTAKLDQMRDALKRLNLEISKDEGINLSAQGKPAQDLLDKYKDLQKQIVIVNTIGAEKTGWAQSLEKAADIVDKLSKQDLERLKRQLVEVIKIGENEDLDVTVLLARFMQAIEQTENRVKMFAREVPNALRGVELAEAARPLETAVTEYDRKVRDAQAAFEQGLFGKGADAAFRLADALAQTDREFDKVLQSQDASRKAVEDSTRSMRQQNEIAQLNAKLAVSEGAQAEKIKAQIQSRTTAHKLENLEIERKNALIGKTAAEQAALNKEYAAQAKAIRESGGAAISQLSAEQERQVRDLVRSVDPLKQVFADIQNQSELLEDAVNSGMITWDEYGKVLEALGIRLRRTEQQVRAPITALEDQARALESQNKEKSLGIQASLAFGSAQVQLKLEAIGVSEALALTNLELQKQRALATTAGDQLEELSKNYDRLRAATVDSFRLQREEIKAGIGKEANELLLEPFKNAIRGIQQSFTQFFEDVFSGGIKSFGDLASSIKRVFVKLAAEIAALLVFKPVVGGILQNIGLGNLADQLGLFKGVSGAGTAGGSSGAGGEGLGSLTGIFGRLTGSFDRLISSANQLSLGGLFSTSGVESTVSGFGAGASDSFASIIPGEGLLPFGLGDALPFIGAALPGLISGNFKQAGAGVAGAGIGAAIGSFIPGIGTALGAAIGGTLANTISSIFGFGKKKSVGPGVVGLTTFADGGFDFAGTETDNKGDPAQARQLGEQLTAALKAIQQTTQMSVREGFQFALGFNPTEKFTFNLRRLGPEGDYPIDLRTDVKHFETFDEAFIAGLRKAIEMGDFTDVGGDIAKAISNSTATKIEDFAKDIDFAAGFRQAFEFLSSGLDPINSQIAQMTKSADQFAEQFEKTSAEFIDRAVDLKLVSAPEATEAMRQFARATLGLVDVKEPLTGAALQIEQVRLNFEALQPWLESIGFSAAEAADMISQGLANFREDLGTNFLESLRRDTQQALGKGFLAEIENIGKQADSTFKDAISILGTSGPGIAQAVGDINDRFGAKLRGLFEGLDSTQLDEVIATYRDATDVQGAFIRQLAEVIKIEKDIGEVVSETTESVQDLVPSMKDMLAQFNELTGRGYLNDVASALSEMNSIVNNPLTAVVTRYQAMENFGQFIQNLVDGMVEAGDSEGLQNLIDTFGNIPVVATKAAAGLDLIPTALERLADSVAEVLGSFNSSIDEILHTGLGDRLRRASGLDPSSGAFAVLLAPLRAIADSTTIEGARDKLEDFSEFFNTFAADTQKLSDLGITPEELAAIGQLGATLFREVESSLENVSTTADQTADDLDDFARRLASSFASVRSLLSGGLTTGITELGVEVGTALQALAPNLRGMIEGPIQSFLDAARTGTGFMDEFVNAINAILSLEGTANITPEQIDSLREIVSGILDLGIETSRKVAEVPPEQSPDVIEDLSGRRTSFMQDVQARLLDSQGKVLEAQLYRFDAAADAARAEAQQLGVDLGKLNQVLDMERAAIIEQWNAQVLEFTDNLQVRLLRATGKTLEAQLLEFDIGAAQLRDDASRLGVDMGLVNDVLAAERENIINGTAGFSDNITSAFDDIVKSLRIFVDEIGFIPESLSDPIKKLAEARESFGRAIDAAKGGSQEAIGRLPDLARTVLQFGQEVFASGPAFFQLYDQVRSTLEMTLGVVEDLVPDPGDDQTEQQEEMVTRLRSIDDYSSKVAEASAKTATLIEQVLGVLAQGTQRQIGELVIANEHLNYLENAARELRNSPQTYGLHRTG